MRTVKYLIVTLILLVAVSGLCGCGSNAPTGGDALQPDSGGTQPVVGDEGRDPSPGLPVPSRLTAHLDVDFGGFFFGDQHRIDLPRWNYRYIGENQVGLDPASDPDRDTAVVMFYCDLAAVDHNSTLHLYWDQDHDYGDVWVGFADYTANQWDWVPVTESNTVNFDAAAHLVGGMLLYAVLVTGPDEWVLDHTWVGEVCPPLIAGVTPCGGREGETLTFEATLLPGSGPVDEWNWNFGGSCTDPPTSNAVSPVVTLLTPNIYTSEVHATNAAGTTDFSFRVVVQESWTTWEISAVTGGFEDLITTSLALEPDGDQLPHIACATTEDAYYCQYNGADWWVIWVDHANLGDLSISNTCLATNSDGQIYMVYANTYSAINLFWFDGFTWQQEELVENDVPGYTLRFYGPRIALASFGEPQICYKMSEWADDWDADYVRHMYREGTVWHTTGTVANSGGLMSTGTIEPMVPMALDSDGYPYIAWYDDTPGNLNMGQYDTAWHDSVIDATHSTSQISVAIDSTAKPHVAYIVSGAPSQIYYAVYDAGWDVTPVPSALHVDEEISLKLDSNDEPHIAYYQSVNQDLHMTYREGADWYNTHIDALGDVGQGCSLVIDNADRAHISYFDWSEEMVKYAVEPVM